MYNRSLPSLSLLALFLPFQHGKDRTKCLELLESESARVAHGGPLNRRFSLQGIQLQGRRRDSTNSLVQFHSSGGSGGGFWPPCTSSSSSSGEATPSRVKKGSKRRRFSDFGLAAVTRRTSSVAQEEEEDDDGRLSVPTVVLTKESPPPQARLSSPFPSDPDCGRVETLFSPDCPRQLTPTCDVVDPTEEAKGDDFLLLGNASSLTAVCLDVEPGPRDVGDVGDVKTVDEDLLNNNLSPGFDDDKQSVASSSMASSSTSSRASCSLSTTTLSQGELRLIRPGGQEDDAEEVNRPRRRQRRSPLSVTTTAFTTISRDTVSVTNFDSEGGRPVITKTSTSSTIFWNNDNSTVARSNHYNSNLCSENPFRKVFAKRKEFYQNIAEKESKVSSVNRLLLRKRHCAVCCAESRTCPTASREHKCANAATQSEDFVEDGGSGKGNDASSSSRLTLDADIQPFLPFTIRHDLLLADGGPGAASEIALKDGAAGLIRSPSSSSDLARRLLLQQGSAAAGCGGEGLMLDPEGGLHYAASAINSEDGVESRLEVSVGADGSSVITTRHKRLGSPSEISNNSVVQVQVEEGGGKVVKIQHSQQKTTTSSLTQGEQRSRPRGLLPNSASAGSLSGLLLPPGLLVDLASGSGRPRPSSAYCTQVSPALGTSSPWMTTQEQRQQLQQQYYPRYNSLPNMDGRPPPPPLPVSLLANKGYPTTIEDLEDEHQQGWAYNTHPADEEKRLAFTRGTTTTNGMTDE